MLQSLPSLPSGWLLEREDPAEGLLAGHPAERVTSALFEGLPAAELAWTLRSLPRHRFPAGAVVLAQGEENRRAIYLIQSGCAHVLLTAPSGDSHTITCLGPGATVGEMSFITGQPVSATVRAVTDLEVRVLDRDAFARLADAFPHLYRNLGMILAQRLADTNRQLLQPRHRAVTLLLDEDAPPLLGYALACSTAWHTRKATLLLVPTDGAPPLELEALARGCSVPGLSGWQAGAPSVPPNARLPHEARAELAFVRCGSGCAAERLAVALDALSQSYPHVFVQARREISLSLLRATTVRLCGRSHPPSEHNGDRAVTLRAWTERPGAARPDDRGMLDVPALVPADEEALRRGLLPSGTAAGRALGWAARHLAGLKVGLALGAGAEKGYAHIGVLRTLERAGLPIDFIGGTSIGACIAAGHASGFTPEEAVEHLGLMSRALFRPTLPLTSLHSSTRLRGVCRQIFGDRRIEDVPMPLGIVAADMRSRQEVVFRHGPVWHALLASTAIPGIYPPQRIGPHVLVDGAVLNPMPGAVVSEMGADVVLGVRLEGPATGSRAATAPAAEFPAGPAPRQPSILEVIMRSIEMMQSKISADTAVPATLVIEPSFPETDRPGLRRFAQGRCYIEAGEAAAEAALPRIRAALPWLQR